MALLAAVAVSNAAESQSVQAAREPTPQQGYSTATLREPIFDAAQVMVETMGLNNWLAANYKNLQEQQRKGAREHAFYLIDSRIKEEFRASGRILPAKHDIDLELLFSWTEPLGAYGGNLVYNRLKRPEAEARRPLLQVPTGMSLALRDDLFELRSDAGWSISFPYYFMIGRLSDFTASGGLPTQLMIVSTGSARDKSKFGHSQATLMLMFSPATDCAAFGGYWARLYEIPESGERVELGVRGLSSQRTYVPDVVLHKELAWWREGPGCFAAAYLGNDGTYQWNRQHYPDFIRSLHVAAHQDKTGSGATSADSPDEGR